MWIDTHNHFDAPDFDLNRQKKWQQAQALGVSAQCLMGVRLGDLSRQVRVADELPDTYFALGLHPLFVGELVLDAAIAVLTQTIERYLNHPKFIGIGEIGLDGRKAHGGKLSVPFEKQCAFFKAQLALAYDYDLPVFMHSVKAEDKVLQYCKTVGVRRGIAHAFGGSEQQAHQFITQGFKLGFGGAMTYPRAKKYQRLIQTLPLSAFVLETDAPDMPPVWIKDGANQVSELPRIAATFAEIRGITPNELAPVIWQNTGAVVPAIAQLDRP